MIGRGGDAVWVFAVWHDCNAGNSPYTVINLITTVWLLGCDHRRPNTATACLSPRLRLYSIHYLDGGGFGHSGASANQTVRSVHPRLAGALAAGIGVALLIENIEAALLL